MKWSIAVLALVATLANAEFQVGKDDEGVLVLDQGNFDATLEEFSSGIMVEFYAPWCGHCKKLAPEYKKAAQTLMKEDPAPRLAMVDATEERELAERYGVRGFPTLKFIRNGVASDYEGGRSERDIVAFMKKKTGPPSKELEDAAALEKAKSSEAVVTAYLSSEDAPEAKVFMDFASSNDDLEFYHTFQVDLIEGAKANTLVVFKQFDELKNEFPLTASTTQEELAAFVSLKTTPKLIEFSQERTKQIFRGSVKVHMLTFVDTKAAYFDDLKSTLLETAEANHGKLLHIYVPASEERVMSYFGFKSEDLPKTVIADMSSEGAMKKYMYEGKDHKAADLAKFEADFFEGALSPTLKSEEDKPSNMKGPVKVITGKSFEKTVVDGNKDVLLEFYAPWCGHCKALAPKWDELGEKFEDVDSVMIAKMDATANEIDHPDINVRGFPTIFYIPAGGKPVQYDGGREVDDFVKYLQKHATKDFSLDGDVKGGPSHKSEL